MGNIKFRQESEDNDQFIDLRMEVAPKGTNVKIIAKFPDGTEEEVLSFLKSIIWVHSGAKRLGVDTISNLSGRKMEFFVKPNANCTKDEEVKG